MFFIRHFFRKSTSFNYRLFYYSNFFSQELDEVGASSCPLQAGALSRTSPDFSKINIMTVAGVSLVQYKRRAGLRHLPCNQNYCMKYRIPIPLTPDEMQCTNAHTQNNIISQTELKEFFRELRELNKTSFDRTSMKTFFFCSSFC